MIAMKYQIPSSGSKVQNEREWIYASPSNESLIDMLPAGNFTTLEVMASSMGRCVVTDRVLGIDKMVEDAYNGFNCAATTEAFVNRIERLIRQQELFERYASINRSLVERAWRYGTAKVFAEISRVCSQSMKLWHAIWKTGRISRSRSVIW